MFHLLLLASSPEETAALRRQLSAVEPLVLQLSEAHSLAAAKQCIQSENIDIIIAGESLPDGSALSLLRCLREDGLRCEFVFYTAEQSFSLIQEALRLGAADYILQPAAEGELQERLRALLVRLSGLDRSPATAHWLENNNRIRLLFWDAALHGRQNELLRGLFPAPGAAPWGNERYMLVVTRFTNILQDRLNFTPPLLGYALENVHSELLCGTPENSSAVFLEEEHKLVVATICSLRSEAQLEHDCRKLMAALQSVFSSDVTCCLCRPCSVSELNLTFYLALNQMNENVADYGSWFWVDNVRPSMHPTEEQPVSYRRYAVLLAEDRGQELLATIRRRLMHAKLQDNLDSRLLTAIMGELTQCVYVDLASHDVNAAQIAEVDGLNELSGKATRSESDLMRWAEAIVAAGARLKQERRDETGWQKSVDRYIEEHYSEDINREVIAERMFLSPVYLGMMYKRNAGISISEKINECRISHARMLLASSPVSVAEVASAVGYGGQAYFSTVFKKSVGMTPQEYRRSLTAEKKENQQ